MSTAIKYGIIGLLVPLLGVVGTLVLQQGELDKAYVCSTTEEVGLFSRLSSTNRTAYPLPVGNNTGSKLCSGGVWVSCSDYGSIHNFTCSEEAEETINIPVSQCIVLLNGSQTVCFDSTNSTLVDEIKVELAK